MRSSIALALIGFVGATLGVLAAAAPARADACFDLWYARNAIYNDYGFCFKTTDGKKYFDNSDCTANVVHLSHSDQQRVNSIIAQEKALGCR